MNEFLLTQTGIRELLAIQYYGGKVKYIFKSCIICGDDFTSEADFERMKRELRRFNKDYYGR